MVGCFESSRRRLTQTIWPPCCTSFSMAIRTTRSKRRRRQDHVPPHRVWTFLYADGALRREEHDHILECAQCLRLLELCLKGESFGHVLKELQQEPPKTRAA